MHQDLQRLPSSQMCGTCHRAEFEEYTTLYEPSVKEGAAYGCVDCHMPAYRDRLTQKSLLSLLHPKRIVHDHSTPVWTGWPVDRAITLDRLSLSRQQGHEFRVEFALTNCGAGHRIPTGEFGDRTVTIRIELLDKDRKPLGHDKIVLTTNSRRRLAPAESTSFTATIRLSGETEPKSVRVSVERSAGEPSSTMTLLDHEQNLVEERRPLATSVAGRRFGHFRDFLGQYEIVLGVADNQQRAGGFASHLFGDAAQQHVSDAAERMRSHHDQIDVFAFCVPDDLKDRIAPFHNTSGV